MGSVKIDTTKGERSIDTQYAGLDSPATIKRLLRDYNALIERQYAGDYDAVVLLADLETAIERAGLTARQRQALALVYIEDLTQKDVAARLNIRQPNVAAYTDRACEKIAEIYEMWAWEGEGYSFYDFSEGVE